ncbi:MAG: hypothetical protein ACRDD1_13740, partial [Planctomycetia bacterium]
MAGFGRRIGVAEGVALLRLLTALARRWRIGIIYICQHLAAKLLGPVAALVVAEALFTEGLFLTDKSFRTPVVVAPASLWWSTVPVEACALI